MAETASSADAAAPANETCAKSREQANETASSTDNVPESSRLDEDKDDEAATEGTEGSGTDDKRTTSAIVSSSKKSRPPYKYSPDKITLRFLFANRDGLTVTIECDPTDTVGEAKGALLSVWPEDLPDCSGGDRIRLVCMGKGYLMPDSRTLQDCGIPVFKTHPTPINVSIRPETIGEEVASKKGKGGKDADIGFNDIPSNVAATSQGCGCTIL